MTGLAPLRRSPAARLAAAAALMALVWCGLLPWVLELGPVARHVALMEARGFTANDFANLHPAGSLGRRLSRVRDHMHPRENIPVVTPGDDFHHVLEAVTKGNFGIAAVISVDGHLLGSVSDGDVRRHLLKSGARALAAKVSDFMKSAPRVVKPDMLAIDAVTMMESNQITSLFVVEPGLESRLAGLVRMHDLLAAKIV